jgi:hypothetical protein
MSLMGRMGWVYGRILEGVGGSSLANNFLKNLAG